LRRSSRRRDENEDRGGKNCDAHDAILRGGPLRDRAACCGPGAFSRK
jgi:hypothetical protein